VPDVTADLYAVEPESFTAARNALVKKLRVASDKDQATRVAKLRRPTVSAWALNQVARTSPRLIENLLAAGASLQAAMSEALSGDGSRLHAAEAEERTAVDAICSAAGCVGRTLTDEHRQRMVATLRAAVLDETVAHALRDGCLDSDHEAPSFGFDAVPTTVAKAVKTRPDSKEAARQREDKVKLAALEHEALRLGQRAARLNTEAADLERRAVHRRSEADQATEDARAAASKLDQARP
jgi:hypothetical protein